MTDGPQWAVCSETFYRELRAQLSWAFPILDRIAQRAATYMFAVSREVGGHR